MSPDRQFSGTNPHLTLIAFIFVSFEVDELPGPDYAKQKYPLRRAGPSVVIHPRPKDQRTERPKEGKGPRSRNRNRNRRFLRRRKI